MDPEFLPYGRQTIDDDDIAAVVAALRAPQLTQGPLVARFEAALAAHIGAPFVSVCATGTAALHLVYAALGLGAGDEIITSPITFSATASAAYQVGASVRFADVEPDTGNLDVASVEALITGRTRALVAVHLGGLPADLAPLRRLADRHGLWLIEDAAHALGATYLGAHVGAAWSDAATFSFHPVKHLTTAEGGAVAVHDPELKRRIDTLRHHAIERASERLESPSPGPWYYEIQGQGFNYRLSDVQCALGLSQLAKQPAAVARRRAIAATYRRAIAERFGGRVTPQPERAGRESSYHLFPVAIDFAGLGTSRTAVVEHLRARGVGTQVHYIPLTVQPHHRRRGGPSGARPGVDHYYQRTLSLPMYPALDDADLARVVDALAASLVEVST